MLLFLDESGTDHKEAPYEVLAGLAVAERQAWPLIEAIRMAQLETFGVELVEVLKEFKGSQLLDRRKFRLAAQLPPLELWLQWGCQPTPGESNHRNFLYMFSYKDLSNKNRSQGNEKFGSDEHFYVGETFELPTRLKDHCSKKPSWVVALTPADGIYEASLSAEVRKVAESVLICFFDEILRVGNTKRGHDFKPHFSFFQQGVALATAAAASLVWLARATHDFATNQPSTAPQDSHMTPDVQPSSTPQQPPSPEQIKVLLPFKSANLQGWNSGLSYLNPA